MTAFIERLESQFLNQLEDRDVPRHLDAKDKEAVHSWFREAFGRWFLRHRDDVLAREWSRRGWAEPVLKPTEAGELKESYRVKPECAETIEDWMQDRIE